MAKSAIVIPARLASTRLSRKLLLKETGKTVLQHTYESAAKSTLADRVIVAADDLEIVDEVLLPEDLPSGEYVLGWR